MEKDDSDIEAIKRLNANDPTLTVLIIQLKPIKLSRRLITLEAVKTVGLHQQINLYLTGKISRQLFEDAVGIKPCYVTSIVPKNVGEALNNNHTVSTLIIHGLDTIFGRAGFLFMAGAVMCPSLKNLYISNCYLGRSWSLALGAGLRHGSNLINIVIRNTPIGTIGCVEIGVSLTTNTRLRTLNLDSSPANFRNDDYPKEYKLVDRLFSKHGLRYLKYEDAGAVALGWGLSMNTTLRALNLTNFGLDDAGTTAIAKGISHNNTLEILVMTRNGIGEVGATALAAALYTNTTLTSLNTVYNFDDNPKAIQTICDALTYNGTITHPGLYKKGALNLTNRNIVNTKRKMTTFTELLITPHALKKTRYP